MKRIDSQSRGMTAVEVLAATVLASLMLAAVAGLTGGLARQTRLLRAGGEAPQWHQQLADQLLWDLKNSRRFIASPQGLRLEGFAGRDFVTGRPTARPAIIQYYLVESASGRCLVRRQQHLDSLSNNSARVDLVCHDVDRIVWGSVVVDRIVTASAGLTDSGDLTAVPERIAIQLYSRESSRPFLDRTLHLR